MSNEVNVLFSSRTSYELLFAKLKSTAYNSLHVTLNLKEKAHVESLGGIVIGCFEEEFSTLEEAEIPHPFLQSSYYGDRALWIFDIEERKSILGKAITFWRNIFKKHKFDLLVHETIAVEYEEVMYLMAQEKGVKVGSFLGSPFAGTFYWKESSYHSSFSDKYLSDVQIKPDAEMAVVDFINKVRGEGIKLGYLDNKLKRRNVGAVRTGLSLFKLGVKEKLGLVKTYSWEDIRQDTIFNHGHKKRNVDNYEFLLDRYYTSKMNYDNIEKYSSLFRILFPFHFEPEATLLYFNSNYSEQITVIQELLKQLPSDGVLFVKEHPQQPGTLMKPHFLALRKRNSNLKYLPAEHDSLSILGQMDLLVTICGTIGMEALVKEIPVIVLGNVFYDKHPDVYKVSSYEEVRQILSSKNLKVAKEENTIQFLKTIYSLVHQGDPNYISKFDDKENISNMVCAIEKYLGL